MRTQVERGYNDQGARGYNPLNGKIDYKLIYLNHIRIKTFEVDEFEGL